MCSHETYMDCPYYEQLMYVGDTRLQVLTTFATSRDDRLPRKALEVFDFSRAAGPNGPTFPPPSPPSREARLPRKALEVFDFSRAAGHNGLTMARYPTKILQTI